MASTSKSESKPVRGILKTSKNPTKSEELHQYKQPKGKKRKLPPWMQKSADLKNQTKPTRQIVLKIPNTCRIIYSHNDNDCSTICHNFLEGLNETCFIGFDIEWPVSYSSSDEPKTAVIQICDAPAKRCFVFQISCMGFLPSPLREIIETESIIKVGLNIEGDLYKLARDFDVRFPKHGYIDLSQFANNVLRSNEKWSLAGLVKFLFHSELPKTDSIRKSDWTQFPLSTAQLEYAALDAVASLMAYDDLKARCAHAEM